MNNVPKIIDMDLVIELRTRGKHFEALELIRAHQDSLKKEWAEGKKKNKSLELKIRNQKRRNNGECVCCGKKMPEDRKGKWNCVHCNKRQYNNKTQENGKYTKI